MSHREHGHCLNCEAELYGKFCHVCGQKVIEPSEKRFTHFVFQFFGSAFFLENNFVKNVWTLLAKPGRLTLDFIEGRRKRWMPPFSLFLLINLFYFWYSPLTDFNPTLYEHMNVSPHKGFATQLVSDKLKASGETLANYSLTFDGKSVAYANSLIVLHLPILGLLLFFLFYQNRYYYVDNFIFALHLLAFILLLALILSGLLAINAHWFRFITDNSSYFIGLFIFSSIFLYLWKSVRSVYKRKWWATASYIPLIIFAFGITHFGYRFILFLIILSLT